MTCFEDDPPRTVPVGGYVKPGEDPDDNPDIYEVLRENGWVFSRNNSAHNSLILSFIDKDESLSHNSIWAGNAYHKATLGNEPLLKTDSAAKVSRIMRDEGYTITISTNEINALALIKDPSTHKNAIMEGKAWYLRFKDGDNADVYKKLYEITDAADPKENGWIYIIHDPDEYEPDDPDRPAEIYAELVGYDDSFGGERPTFPDEIDPSPEPYIDPIPVIPPSEDPILSTIYWWKDLRDGIWKRKHFCDDGFVFVKEDLDRDSTYESAVVVTLPNESNVTVPLTLDDEDSATFTVTRIAQDALFGSKSNEIAGAKPDLSMQVLGNNNNNPSYDVEVEGNVVYAKAGTDGSCFYEKYYIDGDIAFVVNNVNGYEATVIGASADTFNNTTRAINIASSASVPRGEQTISVVVNKVDRCAFNEINGVNFERSGYGLTGKKADNVESTDPYYTNLPSARIECSDAVRANSGIASFTGTDYSDNLYWVSEGNKFVQAFPEGDFIVSYATNVPRTGEISLRVRKFEGLTVAGRGRDNLEFNSTRISAGTDNYDASIISDHVFRNSSATFTFKAGAYSMGEGAALALLGSRTDNEGKAIKFAKLTGEQYLTYVAVKSDGLFTYYVTKESGSGVIVSYITGLVDNLFKHENLNVPLNVGGYRAKSVLDGAFYESNAKRNTAKVTKTSNATTFGSDIVADTGKVYEITDELKNNFGLTGSYTDGVNGTYSQTYKEKFDISGNRATRATAEFIEYTYKFVHDDGVSTFTTENALNHNAEMYAIIEDANTRGLFPIDDREDPATFVYFPTYVPSGDNGEMALVIWVTDKARNKVLEKRNIGYNAENGLPKDRTPQSEVFITIQRERPSGGTFDEFTEVKQDPRFVLNAADHPGLPEELDGKAGIAVSGEQGMNEDTSEIAALLGAEVFNTPEKEHKPYGDVGFLKPTLYFRNPDTGVETETKVDKASMPVMGENTVYELRFDREEYWIHEHVIIDVVGRNTMLDFGRWKAKNGSDLSSLVNYQGAKGYVGMQWYQAFNNNLQSPDTSDSDLFEDTILQKTSPVTAADGDKHIYGKISGNRYKVTFDALSGVPTTVAGAHAGEKEQVVWSTGDWAHNDDNKQADLQSSRILHAYTYYDKSLGYFWNKVLGKGEDKLPGEAQSTATDRSSKALPAITGSDGPTMTNYNFVGWFPDSTKNNGESPLYTNGGAAYKRININDGTANKLKDSETTGTSVGTLHDPEDTGITLYAQYIGKPHNVILTASTAAIGTGTAYNSSTKVGYQSSVDGKVNNANSITTVVRYDQTYSSGSNGFPNPSRTGYTFNGWKTSNGGSTQRLGSDRMSVTGTSAETLYAHWTRNAYTVKFNGNGATSGSMSNQSFSYDTWQKLTNKGFSRTGYTFAGWNTKANGTGAGYSNQASVRNLTSTNNATVNLYAQWTPVTYTITYNLGGGSLPTGNSNPTSYTIETNTFTLINPSKANYNFAGWTGTGLTSASTSVKVNKGSTGNRSYTATFTPKTYTVTFDLGAGAGNGATAVASKTYKYGTGLSSLPSTSWGTTYSSYSGGINSSTGPSTKYTHTFDGWYYNGTKYTSIPSTMAGNITLTARWNTTSTSRTWYAATAGTTTYPSSFTVYVKFASDGDMRARTISETSSYTDVRAGANANGDIAFAYTYNKTTGVVGIKSKRPSTNTNYFYRNSGDSSYFFSISGTNESTFSAIGTTSAGTAAHWSVDW